MAKSRTSYDAVIVGAGAGGGACAWALVRKGLSVLVLDAGPSFDPTRDYLANKSNWEEGFPEKAGSRGRYSVAELQSLEAKWRHIRSWNHVGGPLNPSDRRISLGYQHVRGVGGSTLHFTGEAHRINPRAMKLKSQFGVAADWPVSYDELEPFYTQAERIVGVAGPSNDRLRPRSSPYPYAPHPLSYASRYLLQGFKNKGLYLTENSLAVLPSARPGRAACNYCGCCLKGCPRQDKGSVDVTYLREAVATGKCQIQPMSVVTRVVANGDAIGGVYCRDSNGERLIEAAIVILACGAIETPRLLLNSADSKSPDGLANESGLVGKNFMETLTWTSNAISEKHLGSHRGLPVDSICWDFNNPDSIPNVIGGCRVAPSVAESDLIGPVNYARRVASGWGLKHKNQMRDLFGNVLSLSGICESLPNPRSYVDLDPILKDVNGLPIARIHSYVDEMAARRIEFMAKICRDIFAGIGEKNIFEEFGSYDIFSSTHVFGTCRMGRLANDSVVNEWCRSHRWKNLYIVDASVFPSSGGGESPSLTIQALALRAMQSING